MIVLSREQVIALHTQLIAETGGFDGIRDDSLLESALNAPFQSFDGIDVFPSIQQKAARLAFGLIKNHAFIDGNKRIGVHTMLVFLDLNKIELDYTQDELSDTVLKIAAGELDFEDLLQWILKHQL
ncbi:MAG: type II toxin-antitoxin system death-on-curing family toxin [Ruminococcus sp.]